MEVARRYADKGQVDKAIREYLRIVAEEPQDVRVWLKIGDLYVKKGAKREATETYLRVANYYSEQGFFLKAVAVYKQILKLNPRLVEVHLKLAELYRQLKLMSDAMQHFEMVAGHFHREGKTSEALETVRQLVELDPNNVATRIKLAELYSKEGMVDNAVTEFTTACDYLRAQRREEDFVKVAERLIWHKADNVPLSRELASIYLRRQDARRALQKLQACFKANPRDVDTLELLAQAFQNLQQSAKTVSVLKEMARVLAEDARHEQAADVYRRILTLAPNDRDALARLNRATASGSGASGAAASGSASMPAPGSSTPMAAQPRTPPAPPPVPKRALTVSMPPPPTEEAQVQERQHEPTGSVPLISDRNPSGAGVVPDPDSELESDFPDEHSFESSVAAEQHSEQIATILTETDVYVKYGLHEKAMEHLRDIFALDPNNIEAHERLKEILVNQGRRDDAVSELMMLAELTAAFAPSRATGYLKELLSLQPAYRPALDLAHRFGLKLELTREGMPVVSSGPNPVLEDSVEFIDIDIGVDDSRQPDDTRVLTGGRGLAGSRPSETELTASELVDTAIIALDDLDADGPETLIGVDAAEPISDLGGFGEDSLLGDSTDIIDLDDAERSALVADALPDPLGAAVESSPTRVMSNFEDEFDLDLEPELELELPVGLSDELSLDLDDFDPSNVEPTAGDTVDFSTGFGNRGPNRSPGKPTGGLDDDLDEADFFVAQGLFSAAHELLQNLLKSHPGHPLITAKIQEVAEFERSAGMSAGVPTRAESELPHRPSSPDDSTLDRRRARAQSPLKPAVVLQDPVDDEDADTHYNLGLAYKEMGLYDDAVKEFEKVLVSPEREVQCRLMMGLCHRENDEILSAINQFKAGLHAPGITLPEQLSLYYEIATSYETVVGDYHEGLYFYEMIQKRDQNYRDLQQRIRICREQVGQQTTNPQRRISNDADAAVDSLLAETERRRG